MSGLFLCVLGLAFLGDTPFAITSGLNHRAYAEGAMDFDVQSFELLGLGDDWAVAEIARLKEFEQGMQKTFVQEMGLLSYVRMQFLDRNGNSHMVTAHKTNVEDPVARNRDLQLAMIGEGGEFEVTEGVTTIRGPTEVKDNGDTVIQWIPWALWAHKGHLFTTEGDDYLVSLVSNGDIAPPPAWTADSCWFYLSYPREVPQRARQRKLQEAFTAIGVHRQRRDGESLDAYQQRVAVVEVWEQFLRSHYFDTEELMARCTTWKFGQPVKFRFEVKAAKGTRFAEIISGLKWRRSTQAVTGGIFSGTINCQLDEQLAQSLSLAVREKFMDFNIDGNLLDVLCMRLHSGKVNGNVCLAKDENDNLACAIRFASATVLEAPTQKFELGMNTGFIWKSLPFLANLQAKTKQENENAIYEWTQGNSEWDIGSQPTNRTQDILQVEINLQELAAAKPKSSASILYDWLERFYLEWLVRRNAVYSLNDDDLQNLGGRQIRDGLRAKIQEGEPEEWKIKLSVGIDRKDSRLNGEVVFGSRVFGFLKVAKYYYEGMALQKSSLIRKQRWPSEN